MCCVMPPNSPSVIFDERILSSSDVLPWSTWPMMVTTGARGDQALGLGLASRHRAHAGLDLLLERHDLGLEAELLGQLDAELGLDDVVDVGHDAALNSSAIRSLRLDAQPVGEIAQRHALGDDHRAVLGVRPLRIVLTSGS